MGGLDGRLKEITAPLGGPLDDQPFGVVVDPVGKVGGREVVANIFDPELGASEDIVDQI
jgi:hypothetical protein